MARLLPVWLGRAGLCQPPRPFAAQAAQRRRVSPLIGCTPRRPARRMRRSADGSARPGGRLRPACGPARSARHRAAACRPAPPDARAPLRFTTMRAEAHITSSGDLCRMPQQDVVISGTSRMRVHLREQHQLHRVERIDRHAEFGEQPRIAGAQYVVRFAGKMPAGDVQRETVPRQPGQSVHASPPNCPARAPPRASPVCGGRARRGSSAGPHRRRAASAARHGRWCIGFIALVSTSTWNPRISASSSMATMSGFMNGSPPVKPIVRVGSPSRSISSEIGRRFGAGQVDQPVVAGRRFDVAVAAGDVAQRAGVEPQRVQRRAAPPRAPFAAGGLHRVTELRRVEQGRHDLIHVISAGVAIG